LEREPSQRPKTAPSNMFLLGPSLGGSMILVLGALSADQEGTYRVSHISVSC